MKTLLVTGFGPFTGFPENPAGKLAAAVDGAVSGGWRVVGVVMPVSYRRAPAQTLASILAHKADAVLGLGVAASGGRWERFGKRVVEGPVDIDGQTLTLLSGPARVPATLDAAGLAAALGLPPSDDAGDYLCNAWLYAIASRAAVPAAFLHVGPEGIEPQRFVAALGADGALR